MGNLPADGVTAFLLALAELFAQVSWPSSNVWESSLCSETNFQLKLLKYSLSICGKIFKSKCFETIDFPQSFFALSKNQVSNQRPRGVARGSRRSEPCPKYWKDIGLDVKIN